MIEIDNPELWCTVRLKEVNTVVIGFECVTWFGKNTDGTRAGFSGGACPEDNFDKADRWATGHIKWDGCSDWNFLPDDCMMHFCSGKDFNQAAERMKWIYREAAKAMGEKFQGDLP